ncbi:MAG: type II toxin-antitoxin system VapC family toxin [Alphaproteobacteria bacterium]|nr:type II toxin-antitoxin system VapC family toxin [Alphaproteobacteria bacterium]
MVAAVFDTNIVIDHLKGLPQVTAELARYDSRSISIVTWIEVMAGARPEHEAETRAILSFFSMVQLGDDVAARAVQLRRSHRVKLPDAIIWASAQMTGRILVTRDMKDFPRNDPGIRVPYKL